MNISLKGRPEKKLNDKLTAIEDIIDFLKDKEDDLTVEDLKDVVVRIPKTIRAELPEQGEGFLFDAQLGKVFALSPSAVFIFSRIQEGKTLGSIIKEMMQSFDVDKDVILNDVQDFIYQLREFGLGADHD